MSYLSDAFDGILSWPPSGSRDDPTPWSPFGVPIGGAQAQPVDAPRAIANTITDGQVPAATGYGDGASGLDGIARYPDGTPILDSTGNPMRKPPLRTLGFAVMRGQDLANQGFADRLLKLREWLQGGGDMDYQANPPGVGYKSDPTYQDAANYVYGAMTAAAGIPEPLARFAGIANNLANGKWRDGPYYTPQQNHQMWSLGRSDYLNNRLSFPGVEPAGPPMVYPPPTDQSAVPFPGLQPLGQPTIYPPRPMDLWSSPAPP